MLLAVPEPGRHQAGVEPGPQACIGDPAVDQAAPLIREQQGHARVREVVAQPVSYRPGRNRKSSGEVDEVTVVERRQPVRCQPMQRRAPPRRCDISPDRAGYVSAGHELVTCAAQRATQRLISND